MANTVDKSQNGTQYTTSVPMTGSDVAFTFQACTYKALIQCSASTSSIYFAAASASHAGIALPFPAAGPPMEIRDCDGLVVTFNGTNATTVQIIEYLRYAIP